MAATSTSLNASNLSSPYSIPEPTPLVGPSVRPPQLQLYTRLLQARTSLHATYPKRGIFKTAASYNASSDQKFTVDLSPTRNGRIPEIRQRRWLQRARIPQTRRATTGVAPTPDYGTFSIIFQDGTPGLEIEDADRPGSGFPCLEMPLLFSLAGAASY
ncbi:hypothetical protein ACJ41O_011123 [Fusarium nematophilum]